MINATNQRLILSRDVDRTRKQRWSGIARLLKHSWASRAASAHARTLHTTPRRREAPRQRFASQPRNQYLWPHDAVQKPTVARRWPLKNTEKVCSWIEISDICWWQKEQQRHSRTFPPHEEKNHTFEVKSTIIT